MDGPGAVFMARGSLAGAKALLGERQREGITLAKARGAYRGAKRLSGRSMRGQLRRRAGAGEQKTALAREFGISRPGGGRRPYPTAAGGTCTRTAMRFRPSPRRYFSTHLASGAHPNRLSMMVPSCHGVPPRTGGVHRADHHGP